MCVLSELVELVTAIDWQSHRSYHNQDSCTSDKEDWIACQHGDLSSKVTTSDSDSLNRLVCIIVVFAAKDTSGGVVVTETRELKETISTLVAKLSIASVASHVITTSRPLNVYTTERTFLTVGYALNCAFLGPLGELFVSFLELFACEIVVPRCMATEAPIMAAPFTSEPDLFFPKPSASSGQFELSYMATVGTGFLCFIIFSFQSQLLIQIFGFTGGELKYLFSPDGTLLAFWVWTRDEDETLFNVCVDNGRDARGTNRLLAAGSLLCSSINGVIADDACILNAEVNGCIEAFIPG